MNQNAIDPIVVLTVEQLRTMLTRSALLGEQAEIAIGFMRGEAGLGLYAWPVLEENAGGRVPFVLKPIASAT